MIHLSSSREELLLKTTSSFCQSLINPPEPAELIVKYFTSANPRITEHGPEWARPRLPFLAQTFSGQAGCIEYLSILSQTLRMNMGNDAFPSTSSGGYVVNAEAKTEDELEAKGVVSVVGQGVFVSVKTGKEWHEKFIYRFSGFDADGKIGHWEIWADPLSAWVAVGGETGDVKLSD